MRRKVMELVDNVKTKMTDQEYIEFCTLLKKNEVSLLLRARDGPLSPSDGELLEHLGVGRPRLSQILNHLTREGWLISRKEGRRRLFELNAGSDALVAELGAREVG